MILFVSTYRRDHLGSMRIPNSAVPFLPPTEFGDSQISCTTVIRRCFPDPIVPRKNPRGKINKQTVLDLVHFVETSKSLTLDERDAILDCLYDHYGTDLF